MLKIIGNKLKFKTKKTMYKQVKKNFGCCCSSYSLLHLYVVILFIFIYSSSFFFLFFSFFCYPNSVDQCKRCIETNASTKLFNILVTSSSNPTIATTLIAVAKIGSRNYGSNGTISSNSVS